LIISGDDPRHLENRLLQKSSAAQKNCALNLRKSRDWGKKMNYWVPRSAGQSRNWAPKNSVKNGNCSVRNTGETSRNCSEPNIAEPHSRPVTSIAVLSTNCSVTHRNC
jgi:hypothetical protein